METALEIAERRRDTLASIKRALERGDEQTALDLLRDYLDMEPKNDAEGSRIN
jgi:hypothetical protein